MAALTQNISNTVNAFGGGPTTKWDEFNWGEANWGEGTQDVIHTVGKFLSNSQPVTSTVSTKVEFFRTISNTLSPTSDPSSQELRDGSGYNYVFRRPTTDGENRNLVSWSEETQTTSTWTCQAAASSTWSES